MFPAGVAAGLIIAWKWEGLGGYRTIASIVDLRASILVMYGKPDFSLLIHGLAGVRVLFIVCWLLSRAQAGKAGLSKYPIYME